MLEPPGEGSELYVAEEEFSATEFSDVWSSFEAAEVAAAEDAAEEVEEVVEAEGAAGAAEEADAEEVAEVEDAAGFFSVLYLLNDTEAAVGASSSVFGMIMYGSSSRYFSRLTVYIFEKSSFLRKRPPFSL